MNVINLNIPLPPVSKKRPRFARRGKFVTTYKDDQSASDESVWLFFAQQQVSGVGKITGAISVQSLFVMPRPKSHYDKQGNIKKKYRDEPHIKKPDLDNLEKFVFDCLNILGIWGDDCQVCESHKQKRFVADGEKPCTTVFISSASVPAYSLGGGNP